MKRVRTPPLERRLEAHVAGAEPEALGLRLLYVTRVGLRELSDYVELGPRGSLEAVHGVGRVLRLLRAGRISPPRDPYGLGEDLDAAAALLRRCQGARVVLRVRRRIDRVLTLWTESGVRQIDRVMDVREEPDGLVVHRMGRHSTVRITRDQVIRYAAASREFLEVLSVEVPTP